MRLMRLASVPSGACKDLSVTNGSVQMEWTGEAVKVNPEAQPRAIGTSLVSRIVVDQFGGDVSYDWHLEGLIVRLNMVRTIYWRGRICRPNSESA
jgi:hypothetical protein